MDKLNIADIVAMLSAVGTIASMIAAVSALQSRSKSNAAADAELKRDVKYILQRVEAASESLGELSQKVDAIDSRLIRTEEGVKSAHKRIDILPSVFPS